MKKQQTNSERMDWETDQSKSGWRLEPQAVQEQS